MTATVQKGPLVWLGLLVLVILFGLCTVFASVVTVAQAWQEHVRARWPEVTTRVDECDLLRTSSNGMRKMYVRCRLTYAVGDEQHATYVYSSNVAAPEIWQYPPNQVAPLEARVAAHSQGTPIAMRYDPADHLNLVPVTAAEVLIGGPHTTNNVKLLGVCAGSFLALLVIARLTWPRSFWQNRYSSIPTNL